MIVRAPFSLTLRELDLYEVLFSSTRCVTTPRVEDNIRSAETLVSY